MALLRDLHDPGSSRGKRQEVAASSNRSASFYRATLLFSSFDLLDIKPDGWLMTCHIHALYVCRKRSMSLKDVLVQQKYGAWWRVPAEQSNSLQNEVLSTAASPHSKEIGPFLRYLCILNFISGSPSSIHLNSMCLVNVPSRAIIVTNARLDRLDQLDQLD